MREISTKPIKVGEHVLIDGIEYVAKSDNIAVRGGCCSSCDVALTECCCIDCEGEGVILKKCVEKQSAKDTPMTLLQLAEWLSKGNGVWKYSKDSHYEAINIEILADYEFKSVDNEYLIRPWGSHEWIKPTLEIYERDCGK